MKNVRIKGLPESTLLSIMRLVDETNCYMQIDSKGVLVSSELEYNLKYFNYLFKKWLKVMQLLEKCYELPTEVCVNV